jgi:hypothetical protein
MIEPRRMLSEVIESLRKVIAPAIAEPYPKTQAYMAAVILEMVARQIEERTDLAESKQVTLASLFESLTRIREAGQSSDGVPKTEEGLCELIEHLYAQRETLDDETFTRANHLIRESLRHLLDQDLKVAGGKAEV